MVKTRSQTEEAPQTKVFEEPPRSPSANEHAGTGAGGGPSTETTFRPPAHPVHLLNRPSEGATYGRARQASPTRSRRSSSSAAARIRNIQLEAEERLAEIKRRELAMEAELIKKRMATEISNIEEEEDEQGSIVNANERIDDWLRQATEPSSEQRETTTPGHTVQANEESTIPVHTPHTPRLERGERQGHTAVHFDHRARSPTPTRHRRGIEQLADAFEKMTRSARPAPRQATDLPIFTGSVNEWLPFRAAMKESTATYGFTTTENMARLRNCLRGEARETVAGLLSTAAHPDQVMYALEQSYGRPEFIVDKTLEDLKRLPRIGSSANEVNVFAVKLQNIVCVLQNLDRRGYLHFPMLAREALDKLNPLLRTRWCDYARQHEKHNVPEIVMLSRFLTAEADLALRYTYAVHPTSCTPAAMRTTKTSGTTTTHAAPTKRKAKENIYATTADTVTPTSTSSPRPPAKYECLVCEGDHTLPKCERFNNMDSEARWEIVKVAAICFKCLESRHHRRHCRARSCGVNGCRRPHHRLLHFEPYSTPSEEPKPTPATTDESVMSVDTSEKQRTGAVLLKVVPVTVTGPNGNVNTYALLDEGATVSLIEEDLAQKLGMKGTAQPLHIRGVAASRRVHSKTVEATVRSKSTNDAHRVKLRTIERLVLHSQSVPIDILKHQHLRELDDSQVCYESAKPQLLIGADHWHLIVSREIKMGKRNEPAASRTELGWVIHGTVPRAIYGRNTEAILHVFTPTSNDYEDDDLHKAIEQHFQIDALGVATTMKIKDTDKRAIEIFDATARRSNGRFEVGLPWRDDDVTTPPSYNAALRRLKSVERKFEKDPSFATRYNQEIEALLEKGYATICDGSEEESARKWYLPHFPVYNPNKPGKVRLVFDAAAKSHGVCLNNLLLEGPDLLQPLQGIMFRFRERPVAVTADIQEMFLRIKVRKEDQPAQMFLWRDRTSDPPRKYKMTAVIFGASSSPFIAHSVRNRNADDFALTHPIAHKSIKRNHYMDDFVESFEDIDTARRAINEVNYVHQKADFKLRSWNSNSIDALRDIEEGLRQKNPTHLASSPDKTLGLLWDAESDHLGFNTALHRVPEEVTERRRPPTKREALGAVMSLYDPLGLLSQFTIRAKVLLQNLWRKKLDWDEPLPEDEAIDFDGWLRELRENIAHLRLPRWYGTAKRKELHVFCDASEQAYAAVAFWRLEREDDDISVVLAAAKSKVAPLKTLSIPRLELQAAVIGARLADTVINGHEWEPDSVTYWSDSQTVLHWIRNDARRYTPFVAHRLGEIAERTESKNWRWIPTAHNVADDATRATRKMVTAQDRWFTGPAFLHRPKHTWMKEEDDIESEDVEVINYAVEEPEPRLPDVSRFSSYERLIRATAYVLLFIERCRGHAARLEVRHLEEAERIWIRKSQQDSFGAELRSLRDGKSINKSSRLYKLDPALINGTLHLNGRIRAAEVPAETKKPVILDGRHPFTRLLIMKKHKMAHHGGRERVVNDLRQQYWILHLRSSVRKVSRDCAVCQIRRTRPRTPVFGDLPTARVDPYHRPFTYCGVDYFGPMHVKIGRRREKRWGALFTCLTTRAVHLELVGSLSTDSALMAIRRMAARRGWPKEMISDNGTNFHGADTELRAAYEEWKSALGDLGLQHRMHWRFIPPGAPNMGGAWERLVRSVKTALTAVLHEKTPGEELLQTLLTEAEHSVNSRPLTHVSVDPRDPEAITPNHFLLGTSTGLPHTGPCQPADRRTWRASQGLANEFWRRWVREYLPTLAPRQATATRGEPQPQAGDLVIIVDSSMPRNTWPRGIIVATYPGPDGHVRSADVRTKGGVFRRPTRKLVVLPRKEGCDESTPGGEL